jgi:Flp pilus assembly protein TadG
MSGLIGFLFPARSGSAHVSSSVCAGAAPAHSPARPPTDPAIDGRPGGGAIRRRGARRPYWRLTGDRSGATIVEFAFVAPVLVLTLLGLFDLGYKSYVASVLQGALHDAARMATVGDRTTAQIDTAVNARLHAFSTGATITIAKKSYSDFAGVKVAEKITSDTVPLNQYNSTDCYEDYNGNGAYDTDRGKSGLGNSEDVVNYDITISYPRLFPLTKLMGLPANDSVHGSTVLRNQPYGSRSAVVTVRCS